MTKALKKIRSQHLPSTPVLSVGIRVKNEAGPLPRLWRSLKSQTLAPLVEWVFLDSGSTDGTRALLETLEAQVYAMPEDQFSYGSSCNLIAGLCQAPIVMLLSGHVALPHQDTLARTAAWLAARPRSAGYLRQIPDPELGSSAYDRAWLRRRYPDTRRPEPILCTRPCAFSNAASVFTRESWADHPFPEVDASEDFLWAEEHRRMGRPIYYFASEPVWHSHRDRPEQVSARVAANVVARHGPRRMPLRAIVMLAGVTGGCLQQGATLGEAIRFGYAHARAYLPKTPLEREPVHSARPRPPSKHTQRRLGLIQHGPEQKARHHGQQALPPDPTREKEPTV